MRKKLCKYFLVSAILLFAIGSVLPGDNIYYMLLRPLGAVSFIMFFIFQVMEKESALLDEDTGSAQGAAHSSKNSGLDGRRMTSSAH